MDNGSFIKQLWQARSFLWSSHLILRITLGNDSLHLFLRMRKLCPEHDFPKFTQDSWQSWNLTPGCLTQHSFSPPHHARSSHSNKLTGSEEGNDPFSGKSTLKIASGLIFWSCVITTIPTSSWLSIFSVKSECPVSRQRWAITHGGDWAYM